MSLSSTVFPFFQITLVQENVNGVQLNEPDVLIKSSQWGFTLCQSTHRHSAFIIVEYHLTEIHSVFLLAPLLRVFILVKVGFLHVFLEDIVFPSVPTFSGCTSRKKTLLLPVVARRRKIWQIWMTWIGPFCSDSAWIATTVLDSLLKL